MKWVCCLVLVILAIKLTIGHDREQLKCRVDIAFVVDSSSSIHVDDFDVQKEFIKDVVGRFDVGPDDVQFAALSYSGNVYDAFKFNTSNDQASVIKDVGNIRYSNGRATRTYKAIGRMRTFLFAPGKGARDDAVHVGIILTDGTTNPGRYDRLSSDQGKNETQRQAQLARDDGILLFAVGIGSHVNEVELRGIATDPDDTFMITVDNYDDLNTEKVKGELSYRACIAVTTQQPSTTAAPPSVPGIPQGEDPKEVCQGKPADVFFILDESSSIHTVANFQLELTFVEQVIDYLDVGVDPAHVGVITFSDDATMQFKLNQYTSKAEVKAAVRTIHWKGGNTYTNKALTMLKDEGFTEANGARTGVAQIGIVITDGNSTDPYKTREAATLVLNEGIYMFAIGVGFHYRPELNILASDPNSEFVFTVDNLGALNKIKELLAYRVCKENQQDSPKEICRRQAADIVFVVDASTSIGQTDFDKLLKFIKGVVSQFDIGLDATRVGLITFSDKPKIEFNLNSYTSSADIENAVANVKWTTGLTYTAEAIQMMSDQSFTADSGARGGDIPKIGILFTDGNSREPTKTRAMAAAAHKLGIHMFAIGVGPYIEEDELKIIASGLNNYFMVNDVSSLLSIRRLLITKACKEGKKSDQLAKKEGMDERRLKEIETLIDILKKAESFH